MEGCTESPAFESGDATDLSENGGSDETTENVSSNIELSKHIGASELSKNVRVLELTECVDETELPNHIGPTELYENVGEKDLSDNVGDKALYEHVADTDASEDVDDAKYPKYFETTEPSESVNDTEMSNNIGDTPESCERQCLNNETEPLCDIKPTLAEACLKSGPIAKAEISTKNHLDDKTLQANSRSEKTQMSKIEIRKCNCDPNDTISKLNNVNFEHHKSYEQNPTGDNTNITKTVFPQNKQSLGCYHQDNSITDYSDHAVERISRKKDSSFTRSATPTPGYLTDEPDSCSQQHTAFTNNFSLDECYKKTIDKNVCVVEPFNDTLKHKKRKTLVLETRKDVRFYDKKQTKRTHKMPNTARTVRDKISPKFVPQKLPSINVGDIQGQFQSTLKRVDRSSAKLRSLFGSEYNANYENLISNLNQPYSSKMVKAAANSSSVSQVPLERKYSTCDNYSGVRKPPHYNLSPRVLPPIRCSGIVKPTQELDLQASDDGTEGYILRKKCGFSSHYKCKFIMLICFACLLTPIDLSLQSIRVFLILSNASHHTTLNLF